MAKERIKMTPELEEEICLSVSTSPYMLEELCEENLHWPCAREIYRHRIRDESFGQRYARAKQAQIEVLISRMFMLSRSKKGSYLIDKDGIKFADNVAICNKRHEIDNIKWLAAKLAPKIYGERKSEQPDNNDALSQFRVEDK